MPGEPVSLAANPPGSVPFHRIPEFPPKGKGNSVMDQSVPQKKQLSPGAGNKPSFVKYLPDIIPSL
jgi:hypothetical protein